MRQYLLFIFLPVILFSVSCNKDGGGSEPDVPSTVTITSPVAMTLYINGTTLRVEGEMADNNVLSSARVEIRNKSTGAILFQQSSTTGNVGFYRFLWNWTVSGVTAPFTATVKVTAKDKLSNEVIKEVDVQLDL